MFRYFELTGESLKQFLADEQEETTLLRASHEGILNHESGIEGYRRDVNGTVKCVKFKGKTPPADGEWVTPKGYYKEYRPKKTGAASKEWRERFESWAVKVNCQKALRKRLLLPTFVLTGPHPSGHGVAVSDSFAGHMGKKVFVLVPVGQNEMDAVEERELMGLTAMGKSNKSHRFQAPDDLKELPRWKFVKYCEEHADEGLGNVHRIPKWSFQ